MPRTNIRTDGYAPIASYGVIGDGRTIALVAADGAIDWWCAPDLDSAPLLDRLLDGRSANHWTLRPTGQYEVSRRYCRNSNVLRSRYTTSTGTLEIHSSLNSGAAGRLPWSELAQRCVVTEGEVEVEWSIGLNNGWTKLSDGTNGVTFAAGNRLLTCLSSDASMTDVGKVGGTVCLRTGNRLVVAVIVTDGEPHVIPAVVDVDARIDSSDQAWREWSRSVGFDGPYADEVVRSSLALKLLLYSPSGAIAAAGTMALPERIGGDKNYDYRFAWIRDACYTIKAFMRSGLTEEVQAALAWVIRTLDARGTGRPAAFYRLTGEVDGAVKDLDVPGYRDSAPVQTGNPAADQLQLGIFGDVLETVHLFVKQGNRLDPKTTATVLALIESCGRLWRQPDSGIWELEEQRHYTMSKISCWLTFDRAAKLCELGALPDDERAGYERTRDEIESYIESECWDEGKKAYMQAAGSAKLDASLMLATRFGYPNKNRLRATLAAVVNELTVGSLVYRYSGADREEGAFVACSYWLVEAYVFLGMADQARRLMVEVLEASRNDLGLMSEMVDPESGEALGNVPQGLSHLAMIHAADALADGT